MDQKTIINELKEEVKRFCEERDWDKYHNAKDLAIGIVTEASELLEHFRWKNEKEVEEQFKNPKKREEIEDEIADVFHFLLRLAQRYNIDLATVLKNKIEKNKLKYPVNKAKGSNKKYNEI